MTRIENERRRFLAAGSTALAISVAGCSSVVLDRIGDDEDTEVTDDDDADDGNGQDGPEGIPAAVHDYMLENEVNLYDEEIADMTGEEEVTIMNGAGDGLAFDPPVVQVDPGTEVTWEWTGEGGAHNVESTESPEEFTSGETVDEEGHTWSYTFEEEGNYMYHCSPHTTLGMHGAIVVGEVDDGGADAGGDVPDEVDSYLSDNDANLYDGSAEDLTGQEEVTVMNGAGEGFAYDQPAIRVDAGTTVVWEWTGEGGGHNVVSTESPEEFESDDGDLISDEGHTWSYTFEAEGNYMYHCTAHTAQGQHGAVIVE